MPPAEWPSSVERVTIPRLLRPSTLGRALACPLSAVLNAMPKPQVSRLPTHPAAILGSLFHKLVEDAFTGRVPAGGDVLAACRLHLDALLRSKDGELALNPATKHLVPVLGTLPFRKRREREALALKRAVAAYRPPKQPGGTYGGQPHMPQQGVEAEKKSEKLRLAGSLDSFDRSGGVLTIADLKTGNAGAEDEHIRFQLELYGLLARETEPHTKIRLLVSRHEDEEVPFGPQEESEARVKLNALLARLPANEQRKSSDLAQPGAACVGCSFRHVCSSYIEHAGDRWSKTADERLPPDIWGTVTKVETQSGTSVHLRDQAQRNCVVRRLDPNRFDLSAVVPGQPIGFFSALVDGGTEGARGEPRHPTVFAERQAAPDIKRAWDLAIFIGNPGTT